MNVYHVTVALAARDVEAGSHSKCRVGAGAALCEMPS
jgi:hypothetical protein